MRNKSLNATIMQVEKFLDASAETDLAQALTGFGLTAEIIAELANLLATVKNTNLQTDVLLARQKEQTVVKRALKRKLARQIFLLSDLIRSVYPNAIWYSSLGLESSYQTPVKDPDSPQPDKPPKPQIDPKSTAEAQLRARWLKLLTNISSLDPDVQATLDSRGWTVERIAAVRALLDTFTAASEERDRITRLFREQVTTLIQQAKELNATYRSFSRQIRRESGDDPLGVKLEAAAAAL